jgi:hypothetical protein
MRRALAILLMLFGTNVAAAQLCVGNTTFALAPVHGGADFASDKLAHRYALEFRFAVRSVFAAVEAGIKTWDVTSLDGESRALGVTVGLQSPRGSESKFGLCPLLSWTSLSGPHRIEGTPWNYSEYSFSAGLSAGYLLVRTRLWDIVPTAAVTVGAGNPKLTTTYGGSIGQYQGFCCGWQTFTTVRLGFGLGFSDELTLIPAIAFPLGAAGQTTYGIKAALRLGKGI